MGNQNPNLNYAAVFAAIDAAADNFEKQQGDLNEISDNDLFSLQLEQAVVEFNKLHCLNFQPVDVLEKWYEDGQRCVDEFMERDLAEYMNEAQENWNNLKAGWTE